MHSFNCTVCNIALAEARVKFPLQLFSKINSPGYAQDQVFPAESDYFSQPYGHTEYGNIDAK